MSDDAAARVNTPGILLIASGAVYILFYLGYALWSGLSFVLGLIGSSAYLLMLLDSGDGSALFGALCSMTGLLLGGVGLLVYLALAGMGALLVLRGMSMQKLENYGGCKTAAILAVVVPILGILMNIVSEVGSFDLCFGVIFGTIPQLIPLIVGVATAFLVNQTLSDPDVQAAFKS